MKQYLLLVNESVMSNFKAIMPGIEFLEVQGLQNEGWNVNMLVTPIIPPAPIMEVVNPPKSEELTLDVKEAVVA